MKTLRFTRILEAPRDLVFAAFTDPQMLARWWGPEGLGSPVAVEREAPRRLVFESWALGGTGERILESLTTVLLEETGAQTTLKLETQVLRVTEAGRAGLAGLDVGWSRSLVRLEVAVGSPRTVFITREFDAPIERVFKAWLEAKALERWYAPTGCTFRFKKAELRQGGRFLCCISNPQFGECWCEGEYLEVTEPTRIVYRMANSDENGRRLEVAPCGSEARLEWPTETIVTISLMAIGEGGGRTLVCLHQTAPEAVGKKTGAYPSWLSMLDNLAREVS